MNHTGWLTADCPLTVGSEDGTCDPGDGSGRGPGRECCVVTQATWESAHWLTRSAHEPFAYLTTTGRRTGRPHRIEIWFAVEDSRLYLMAGGRDRADWVRNLQANARVTVEIGSETHAGCARILHPDAPEAQRARDLLVGKYQAGNDLDEWGRMSLPVVVAFPEDAAGSPEHHKVSSSPGRRLPDRTGCGMELLLQHRINPIAMWGGVPARCQGTPPVR